MIRKRLTELDIVYKTIFIESICTLESIIENNIEELRQTSPDYQEYKKEDAILDIKEKIKMFEKSYDNLSKEKEIEIPNFF